MNKAKLLEFYRKSAGSRNRWKRRNRFYHQSLENYFAFIIPEGKKWLSWAADWATCCIQLNLRTEWGSTLPRSISNLPGKNILT